MKAQMAIAILFTILSSCTLTTSHLSTRTPTASLLSTNTASLPYTLPSISTTTPTKISPILETGLPPSPTITPNPTQAKQQEDIKNVIQAYFEIRYRLFSVSPPTTIQKNVFGDLVSDSDDAKDFLTTETAKLAVERKWYELNKLRFAKYEYSLKYIDIVVDDSAQTVTVSLYEYFKIICERAMENNPQNPSSCAVGELTHEIVMHNDHDLWKIVSDSYKDSWWRQFRKPGLSTDEILKSINLEMQKLEALPSPTP